jgi:hypothetical protein
MNRKYDPSCLTRADGSLLAKNGESAPASLHQERTMAMSVMRVSLGQQSNSELLEVSKDSKMNRHQVGVINRSFMANRSKSEFVFKPNTSMILYLWKAMVLGVT